MPSARDSTCSPAIWPSESARGLYTRLHCLSCARNIFRAHFLHIARFSTKNARIFRWKLHEKMHTFLSRNMRAQLPEAE
jgi:hypothetical protein